MSIPVIQGNQGKLNKDNEPAYVTQGDYLNAENVRYFTTDGQTDGSHENVVGNSFAFDMGDVDPSVKGYKVCFTSPGAQTNTGWNYFGTPLSISISTQQSYDPHIIEDTQNPGNLWMSIGYNIWYYDSTLFTWTEMTSMVVDSGTTFKSVRLTQSSTGDLACIYVKDFGSGDRYAIRKWNPVLVQWDWLVNASTGFEFADGYTNGNNPARPYGAYYDPQIKYTSSGDLYIFFIGVHYDITRPVTDPYRDGLLIPKVFRYNTVSLIWDYLSGPLSSWTGSYQSGFSLNATYAPPGRVGAITGNIFEYSGNIYFPLVCCGADTFYPFVLDPIISEYNISTNSWSNIMPAAPLFYPGGRRMGTFSPPSLNNIISWAEPTIKIDSLGFLNLCFGSKYTLSTGWFFVWKQTGNPFNPWLAIINPSSIVPFFTSTGISYFDGKVSMVIDSSDDIILSFQDKNVGGKLCVVKYDQSLNTFSLLDSSSISWFPLESKEHDLLLTSTGDLFVSYSDYAYAAGASNYVGYASVQKYFGGGSTPPQDITFAYSNGVTVGTITAPTSFGDIITGLNLLFPSPQYNVTTNLVTNPNGGQCLEFYINPNDNFGLPLLGGFNYYAVSSGTRFNIISISDPIPAAETGALNVIGSYNILDDLFIISTPNNSQIISDNVYEVRSFYIDPNYGLVLTIDKNSDILDNGIVSISNDISSIDYSGDHVCRFDNFSSFSYDIITLTGYFPRPSALVPQTIFVRSASNGCGEIGVAIKDENLSEQLPPASPWTYTRLIRYYALGLSTLKQADMIAEINNRGVSMYWVDDYNVPRSFYYYGPYIQDGGWNNINSLNIYTRSSILDQIKLQKPYSGAFIDYGGQGNGSLLCGNYRYSVRFITNEGIATSWTQLSNPFSVYPVQSDPYRIYGGDENTISGKSNILDVTWPTSNLYEYIELAFTRTIPGGGGSPTSLFSLEQISFARLKLQNNQISLRYEHTGDEINVNNIPDGELGAIPFRIKRAKNVRALDNRLVLSNVDVGYYESDLFDMFDSLRYRLEKKAMPVIGTCSPEDLRRYAWLFPSNAYANTKNATIGEYMLPENVFYFIGYMRNERYRFYGVAEFLDGSLSDAYFLFDVKFDIDGPTPSDPKRVNGLSDFNLNDPNGTGVSGTAINGNVYIPFLRVLLPTILPSINGRPASSLIRRIHIYRENVNNRTIISNGIGILGNKNDAKYNYSSAISGGVMYRNFAGGPHSSYTPIAMQARGNIDINRTFSPIFPTIPAPGIAPPGSEAQYCPFPLFIDRIPLNPEMWIWKVLEGTSPIPNDNIYYYDLGFFNNGGKLYGTEWPEQKRDLVTFYSPDFSITDYRIDKINIQSDFVLNYGHYDNYYSGNYAGTGTYRSAYGFGSFYLNRINATNPQKINLKTTIIDGPVIWTDDGGVVKINDTSIPGGARTYTKIFEHIWSKNPGFDEYYRNFLIMPKGYIFLLSSNVSPIGLDTTTPGKDYGIYNISYGRSLTADQQYGFKSFGRPVPTGAFIDLQTFDTQLAAIGANPPANTIDVFGGDTFTSKAMLKSLFKEPSATAAMSNSTYSSNGRTGDGFEYYCQSYINHQLRHNPDTNNPQTNFIWPNDYSNPQSPSNYSQRFDQYSTIEEVAYNSSYSDKNSVNVSPVFDPDLYYDSRLPATIFYSEPKLQESLIDSYSYIKATNRKDLDISDGPINHHEIFNGNLITFQERAVQQQYFNTTALFANATAQIVMGDGGAVMPRRGITLSAYGLINKWSVVKGRSMGGDDVLYWFDAINKRILRFGADGVVPISTRASVDSFLANNTNYIQLYDTPANDMGVHGIWDESNREVIWTFRARKAGIDYDVLYGINTGYNIGDTVYYNQDIANENYEWHQTGEFYVAQDNLLSGPPSQIPPAPNRPPLWIHIPHTDNKYYNEFTICYSEEKNGFTTFYSFKPKIYLRYKDRYLSPRPIAQQSFLYEHNFGARCVWYTGVNHFDPINDATALKQEAFIEGVVNYNPEMVKTAEALSIDAYIDPNLPGIHRVEVRTKDHNTFMLSTDFNYAETMFRSPIKNDTQGGTVSPDSDTSRPYGRWIAMKFVMDWGYLQSVRSFVMKVRERVRMYNR